MSAPPKMPKPWYLKEPFEFTKYDWRDAVNAAPQWKRETILGRVAVKIADFYNAELGFAFPSLDRLAKELNLAPEKISSAISKLCKAGALQKVHRKNVPPAVAPRKGDRGLFLKLNFTWAAEMGERVSKPRFAKGEESPQLRAGRIRRQHGKITVTDNNTFTVTDNQHPYGDRKVDTLRGNLKDTSVRSDGSNPGVYTREGEKLNSYAQAKGRAA
jgi:hypothetical protein